MKLYGHRNSRALRALWALEEVGAPYEYVEVDIMHGEGRKPSFLKINPGGKIPVLDDGGIIVTESAAICMHLADKFPASQLLPPIGTPERADCYKWISFVLTELDALLWTIAKHRFALPKERRVPAVIDCASWEFEAAVKILAAGLGDRAYLVGESFTVADILAGHILLWAKSARLELGSDSLTGYLNALTTRVAFARAREKAHVLSQVPTGDLKAEI